MSWADKTCWYTLLMYGEGLLSRKFLPYLSERVAPNKQQQQFTWYSVDWLTLDDDLSMILGSGGNHYLTRQYPTRHESHTTARFIKDLLGVSTFTHTHTHTHTHTQRALKIASACVTAFLPPKTRSPASHWAWLTSAASHWAWLHTIHWAWLQTSLWAWLHTSHWAWLTCLTLSLALWSLTRRPGPQMAWNIWL